jgi:hypothetical protein
MLGAVVVGLSSASATASTPVHLTRTVGPIVFDAPAVFRETPDAKSDSIATICTALRHGANPLPIAEPERSRLLFRYGEVPLRTVLDRLHQQCSYWKTRC